MRNILNYEFALDGNQWLFEGQGFYGAVKMEVFIDDRDNTWAWEFSQWFKDDPVFAGSFEPTANNRRALRDEHDALFDAARYLERWFVIDHDEMNRIMALEDQMMIAEMQREEWEVLANA